MIFGWSILLSLVNTVTCARAIAVPNSPLVALNTKRIRTSGTSSRRKNHANGTSNGRDSNHRYHGTDILDPSKSLEERFPMRGGGNTASTSAVVVEKAWVEGAKNSLASALAAAFSKTILAPFDTIKTLQQYHQSTANVASLTLVEAAKDIMQRPGGFLNFYVSSGNCSLC